MLSSETDTRSCFEMSFFVQFLSNFFWVYFLPGSLSLNRIRGRSAMVFLVDLTCFHNSFNAVHSNITHPRIYFFLSHAFSALEDRGLTEVVRLVQTFVPNLGFFDSFSFGVVGIDDELVAT